MTAYYDTSNISVSNSYINDSCSFLLMECTCSRDSSISTPLFLIRPSFIGSHLSPMLPVVTKARPITKIDYERRLSKKHSCDIVPALVADVG